MSTQAQIEANQANAQFSTGPVTPEGKSASAQNSTKHGLTATYPVIRTPGEQLAFDDLTDSFQSELRPITPSDQIIFKTSSTPPGISTVVIASKPKSPNPPHATPSSTIPSPPPSPASPPIASAPNAFSINRSRTYSPVRSPFALPLAAPCRPCKTNPNITAATKKPTSAQPPKWAEMHRAPALQARNTNIAAC